MFEAFCPPSGQRPWSSRILSIEKAAIGFKSETGGGLWFVIRGPKDVDEEEINLNFLHKSVLQTSLKGS